MHATNRSKCGGVCAGCRSCHATGKKPALLAPKGVVWAMSFNVAGGFVGYSVSAPSAPEHHIGHGISVSEPDTSGDVWRESAIGSS
jgi:hypothetical protein